MVIVARDGTDPIIEYRHGYYMVIKGATSISDVGYQPILGGYLRWCDDITVLAEPIEVTDEFIKTLVRLKWGFVNRV